MAASEEGAWSRQRRSSRSRPIDFAIRLDERLIKALDNALALAGARSRYEVALVGPLTMTCDGVEDFLELLEQPGRSVLGFSGSVEHQEGLRVFVRVSAEGFFETASYQIYGDEDRTLVIADALDRCFAEAKDRWSFLRAKNGPMAIAGSLVIVVPPGVLGVVLAHLQVGSHTGQPIPASEMIWATIFALPMIGVWSTVVLRLRGFLCPRLTVAIGDGKRRAEALDRWRFWIASSVIVGPVLAAVGARLLKLF